MTEDLENSLRDIKSDLPEPRINLSHNDKLSLVRRIGPRLCRDIVKAKSQLAESRIPFVFNRVDSQDIVDLLNNDMLDAITEVLAEKVDKT